MAGCEGDDDGSQTPDIFAEVETSISCTLISA